MVLPLYCTYVLSQNPSLLSDLRPAASAMFSDRMRTSTCPDNEMTATVSTSPAGDAGGRPVVR